VRRISTTARPEVTGRKTGHRLLDYQALRERGLPWSRVHLARLEAAGKFPQHINVGENSIAWLESEVDAFIEAKAAERDAKAAERDAKADSPVTDSDHGRHDGVETQRTYVTVRAPAKMMKPRNPLAERPS
jgi:prophage regulatory protein